jgi:hypothetical protein
MKLMTDMRGYSFSRRSFLANTSALVQRGCLGSARPQPNHRLRPHESGSPLRRPSYRSPICCRRY